jgi:hypothetical protein
VVYGIAYAQVTAYLDLPTQTYDVRVVQAGSTDCTSNIVPDLTSVAGTAGLFATIGAIGDFYPIDAATPDAGLDPRIALKLWADEGGIAGGLAVLRFIHTASSLPSLDAGTITNGTFTKIFSDVSFGMTASGDGIDAKGYATIIPSGYAETISLRAAGSSVDALLVPFIALNPSSSQTMFAIGDKTFETAKPLKILFCATDTLLNSLPVSQQPLSQCDPRP